MQRENERLRIGVVGCGSISLAYMRNAPLFRNVVVTACSDIQPDAARARAEQFGLRTLGVDELLADEGIDLVLNLTIPAAHYEVSSRALAAGKHVFTEKPLAATLADGRRLVEAADRAGLAIGSAPDTFLGAAGRQARQLIASGAIGRPVIGTAFMGGRGMEHWHPDPGFYYQPGAGPVLDMGPYYLTMLVDLLGPVRRVQAVSGSGQTHRTITAPGPKTGTDFPVGTPTSVLSLLEFERGTLVTFGASWDVFRHSNRPIELHGTAGSIGLPDPDNFGGTLVVSERGAPWREIDTADQPMGAPNWPVDAPDRANYRMLGLADMAEAIVRKRPARASGALALHVLEVLEAILRAGESGQAQVLVSNAPQPADLDDDALAALLA